MKMMYYCNLHPCLITFQISDSCTARKVDNVSFYKRDFFAESVQQRYLCKSRLGVPQEILFLVTRVYNDCILVRISCQNQQAFL